ncbi:MAG: hypothetical protein CSA07_00720 [Bacteroidia bacterium]|nr:MAG: hypothetical protein CSA07_00720 [Bacteroidia bacterium]
MVMALSAPGSLAGRQERFDRVLGELRHYLVLASLLVLVLRPFYISTLMVLGGVLSLLHIARHHREIPLRRYWPLLLTVGYFLLSALSTWHGIIPNSAGSSIARRVPYVLIPLMLIDLSPRRSWGTALLLGILCLDILLLLLTLRACFTLGPQGWEFSYLLAGCNPADYPLTFHNLFFSPQSHFYYSTITERLGLAYWPSYVGLGNLLGLLVVVSRLLRARQRRWPFYASYAAVLAVLLFFLLLINSRTNLLGALLCLGVLTVWTLRWVRGWRRWVVFGLLGLCLTGLQFTRLNIANVGWSNFESFVEHDARLHMWRETITDAQHWSPWGVGAGGARRYLAARCASNLADYRQDNVSRGVVQKVHNEFLEAFLELGYPGGLYLLGIFLLPLLRLRRFPVESLCLFGALGVLMCFESLGPLTQSIMLLAWVYNLAWLYGISSWHDPADAEGL